MLCLIPSHWPGGKKKQKLNQPLFHSHAPWIELPQEETSAAPPTTQRVPGSRGAPFSLALLSLPPCRTLLSLVVCMRNHGACSPSSRRVPFVRPAPSLRSRAAEQRAEPPSAALLSVGSWERLEEDNAGTATNA